MPSNTALSVASSSRTHRSRRASYAGQGWKKAPSLKSASEGNHVKRGMRGQSVANLQEILKENGYNIKVDGKFGPQTERALKAYQRKNGCKVDGIVGPETMGAILGANFGSAAGRQAARAIGDSSVTRAPTAAERGAGSASAESAGRLTHNDNARRAREAAAATRIAAPAVNETQDARLARYQSAAMNSARSELADGVKENRRRGKNRGDRVEEYARKAGMPPGEWCGHFTAWNYSSAAEAGGAKFTGQKRLHSYQKARSYFMYRSYTSNSRSTIEKNNALKAQHENQGSTRRYMTFSGSVGDKYASRRNLPHEVYNDPSRLPIREGDTALFAHGHVGMVESYDRNSGLLTTIEGNVGDRVQRKTYDLNDPAVRAKFDGFGRPAAGDFVE